MDENQRKPFQFGLKAVFLLVTTICVWLCWEASVSHERQKIRQFVQSNGGTYYISGDRNRFNLLRDWRTEQFSMPLEKFSEADVQRVRKAFPEAQVLRQ